MRWWWWWRWWWQRLWIVALLPLPALPADSGPIKHLHKTRDGALGTTALLENGASQTWSTPNTSRPASARERTTEMTPPRTTEQSRVGKKTRRLLSPAITVSLGTGACNVTLRCVATDGEGVAVNYTWLDSETKVVLAVEPTLQIAQRPPNGSLDFTCVVWNEESKNTSRVSLSDRCRDSPLLSPGSLAAVYVKYLIPSMVAVILLLFLFAMYRRKKGITGSHSQTVSINESSEEIRQRKQGSSQQHPSTNRFQRTWKGGKGREEEVQEEMIDSDEDGHMVTARRSFPPEAFTPVLEETLQTTEALTSCRDTEIPETPDQPSSRE